MVFSVKNAQFLSTVSQSSSKAEKYAQVADPSSTTDILYMPEISTVKPCEL
jgi:hypothetical protein